MRPFHSLIAERTPSKKTFHPSRSSNTSLQTHHSDAISNTPIRDQIAATASVTSAVGFGNQFSAPTITMSPLPSSESLYARGVVIQPRIRPQNFTFKPSPDTKIQESSFNQIIPSLHKLQQEYKLSHQAYQKRREEQDSKKLSTPNISSIQIIPDQQQQQDLPSSSSFKPLSFKEKQRKLLRGLSRSEANLQIQKTPLSKPITPSSSTLNAPKRRISLLESEIHEVFDSNKDMSRRSIQNPNRSRNLEKTMGFNDLFQQYQVQSSTQILPQHQPSYSGLQPGSFPSKKQQYYLGKSIPQALEEREQLEQEKLALDNRHSRFSSTEFMEFTRRKSKVVTEADFHRLEAFSQPPQQQQMIISKFEELQDSQSSPRPADSNQMSSHGKLNNLPSSNANSQNISNEQSSQSFSQLPLISHFQSENMQTSMQSQQQPLYPSYPLIKQLGMIPFSKTLPYSILDGNRSLAVMASNLEGQPRSSEQIMKDFFPNVQAHQRVLDSSQKQELLLLQKQQRFQQYSQIFNELKNKRKTFSKFAFKSVEKQENALIRPVLEELADGDPKGTMSVVDLWSDKNVNKFLGNCKLIKDKLLISKIAAVKKRRGFFLDEKKPFLMSRKDELNLINKVYMKDSSKLFQQKYSRQLGRTMQNELDQGKNPVSTQDISSKKLAEPKLTSQTSINMNNSSLGNINKNQGQFLQQQFSLKGGSQMGRRPSPGKRQTCNSLSEEDNEGDEFDNDDEIPSIDKIIEGWEGADQYKNNTNNKQKGKINYTKFLKDLNIVRTPSKFFENEKITKQLKEVKAHSPKNKGLNMNKVSKLNADIIKDLDYLKEQNDQEYGKLVGKIGCLQDRIVKQRLDCYEALNNSSGGDY